MDVDVVVGRWRHNESWRLSKGLVSLSSMLHLCCQLHLASLDVKVKVHEPLLHLIQVAFHGNHGLLASASAVAHGGQQWEKRAGWG